MKIPYPIQPARVLHEDRDFVPIRIRHIAIAAIGLPSIALIAYAVARFIFSLT